MSDKVFNNAFDWFESDLKTFTEQFKNDIKFAVSIYRALCNMRWRRVDDPRVVYSCSWRYAGGLVANIRDVGEDYLSFYCSGGEGHVSKNVIVLLGKLGWERFPYTENMEDADDYDSDDDS